MGLIQNYEKYTILSVYTEDIQKIKMLLKKKEITVNIEVFSKNDKNITIEYLDINNNKINKLINTSTPHLLYVAWKKNSFLKIKNTYIFEGRLLKSLNKRFVKKNFLPFSKKYEFQLKLKTLSELKLLSFTIKDAKKYIEKGEMQ